MPTLQLGLLRQQLGPLQEEDEVLKQIHDLLKEGTKPEAARMAQHATQSDTRTSFPTRERLAFNEEGRVTYTHTRGTES